MITKVKVVDLTTVQEHGDAVAIVYFENLQGTVHVYRNGTVVLSSPVGTTVSSLHQPDNELWRRTQFLQILARLGATDQELIAAEPMMIDQEKTLRDLGFSTVLKKVADESVTHFQSWCQEHGLEYGAMDEPDIDHLLENALQQVRTK